MVQHRIPPLIPLLLQNHQNRDEGLYICVKSAIGDFGASIIVCIRLCVSSVADYEYLPWSIRRSSSIKCLLKGRRMTDGEG